METLIKNFKIHFKAMMVGSVKMDFSDLVLSNGQDWLAPSTKDHIIKTGKMNITIFDN